MVSRDGGDNPSILPHVLDFVVFNMRIASILFFNALNR